MRRVAAVPTRVNWLFIAILILGFALRLFPVIDYNAAVPDSAKTLRGDEPGYANLARALLAGQGYDWPGRVPGYSTFLAACFRVFGESYHFLRVVQCLIGLIPIWLTYRLGQRLFGTRAGVVAALLVAVSYPLCIEPRLVMSENLFTPMVLVVAWLTVDAIEAPSPGRFALLGFAIGLSDLIRPTLLFYPGFLVLALVLWMRPRQALRLGAVLVMTAGFTILPWTIHNYTRWHAFIPLSTSNATLWQASPEFQKIVDERGYTYVWEQILYGPGWQARDPTSVAGDRYWNRRGLQSILADPLEYIKLCLKRVAKFWLGDPDADWKGYPPLSYTGLVEGGWTPSQAVRLILARGAPLLALLAVVFLWREKKRFDTIMVLLAFATLFHASVIGLARLSEPFQPLISILIAAAFDRLTREPVVSVEA